MHEPLQHPTALTMTWRDLAFLHWPVDPEPLEALLPREVELDRFDGAAWVGVVPFEMRATRFRFTPPVPTATHFPELNVRTYVTHRGRPGVWFFSLDAASRLAVRGARLTFALPYFDARMSISRTEGAIEYASRRTHRGAPAAEFRGRYRAIAAPAPAQRGSLEWFLTERYSLFAARGFGARRSLRGGLLRGDIEHVPWPLRVGEAELDACDMTRLAGIELPGEAPLVHFVDRIDVRAAAPRRVDGATPRGVSVSA